MPRVNNPFSEPRASCNRTPPLTTIAFQHETVESCLVACDWQQELSSRCSRLNNSHFRNLGVLSVTVYLSPQVMCVLRWCTSCLEVCAPGVARVHLRSLAAAQETLAGCPVSFGKWFQLDPYAIHSLNLNPTMFAGNVVQTSRPGPNVFSAQVALVFVTNSGSSSCS